MVLPERLNTSLKILVFGFWGNVFIGCFFCFLMGRRHNHSVQKRKAVRARAIVRDNLNLIQTRRRTGFYRERCLKLAFVQEDFDFFPTNFVEALESGVSSAGSIYMDNCCFDPEVCEISRPSLANYMFDVALSLRNFKPDEKSEFVFNQFREYSALISEFLEIPEVYVTSGVCAERIFILHRIRDAMKNSKCSPCLKKEILASVNSVSEATYLANQRLVESGREDDPLVKNIEGSLLAKLNGTRTTGTVDRNLIAIALASGL